MIVMIILFFKMMNMFSFILYPYNTAIKWTGLFFKSHVVNLRLKKI